ncbi:hypothetical protein H0H93_013633 [Arthromyces matolae]|nr:hypothetical protein H0H93_013633 [Arthromyces matolae]
MDSAAVESLDQSGVKTSMIDKNPAAKTLDEDLMKRVVESSMEDLENWLEDSTVDEATGEWGSYDLYHLGRGLVAKEIKTCLPSNPEYLALQLVRQQTNIPVPKVYRTFTITSQVDPEDLSEEEEEDMEITQVFNIMDHISGCPLSTLWPDMSDDQKRDVARVLGGYVRQLRDIRDPRSSIPGPLAPGSEARICDSPVFDDGIHDSRGPFASYDELTEFLNQRQRMTIGSKTMFNGKRRPELREPVDNSLPLVMTYHGFELDKIILGDDGHLYLNDWRLAGFYPMWFEYVGMRSEAAAVRLCGRGKDGCNGSDELWEEIMLEICGDFKKYDDWFLKMCWTLTYT